MKKEDVKLYPSELTVKLMCIKKKKDWKKKKKQIVSDLSLLKFPKFTIFHTGNFQWGKKNVQDELSIILNNSFQGADIGEHIKQIPD